MKKILVSIVFALVGGVFLFGLNGSTAKKLSIVEKFGNSEVVGESGVYKLDTGHSSIGFEVKHMGLVNIPGYFKDFSGEVDFDAKNITKSTVEFSAKTASVDTRVARRDNHLRSDVFFDSTKHPEMTFKSTKVEKKGEMLIVTGDFTLRGVTKSIMLPVKIAGFAEGRRNSKVMGATAETMINRNDYGVSYGIGGSIATDVKVILNIEARKIVEKKSDK